MHLSPRARSGLLVGSATAGVLLPAVPAIGESTAGRTAASLAAGCAVSVLGLRGYARRTQRAVRAAESANAELRRTNRHLRAMFERLNRTHVSMIAALSRSIEAKDGYTRGHTKRVAEIAVAIAKRLGYVGDDLDAIEVGALLHDVGKIGIPEKILQKAGPLTQEEWAIMRRHPVISDYILAEVELHPIVRQIARSSHERVDGNGYPDGLAGPEIPLPARIVLVADAFDALTSDRSYRAGRNVEAAFAELRANAGTQFCPSVLDALERVYREEAAILTPTTFTAVAVA